MHAFQVIVLNKEMVNEISLCGIPGVLTDTLAKSANGGTVVYMGTG